ncbi:hypothetical protein [Streptomyces antibioticus]|uniref:hypothetical protein n=1 Tax=Streptomyces antibioticus TaxID=1890 RepID=UPI003F484238
MTRSSTAVRWLYLLAAGFTAHCATNTVRHHAPGYALGLATVTVLLVVAAIREYIDADERRAAAVRAERAARLRAIADQRDIRRAADALLVNGTCCERWWTSCGFHHDPDTCTRKGTTR